MSTRKRYWMMKSEPDAFSIDDLERVGTEPWNGVRNYQARNFMRDGMRVGDGVMIGVSAHTVQEALDAVAHGADYLGVGAVFATHTKTDVSEMPRQTLLDICNAVDVPVVAIGGIHKENILQLKGTGVDGVALVSAIFAAKDIEAECRELRALSEQIIK